MNIVVFWCSVCFSCHQYILELCRSEHPVEPDFILSHLDKIKSRYLSPVDVSVYSIDELSFQPKVSLLRYISVYVNICCYRLGNQ